MLFSVAFYQCVTISTLCSGGCTADDERPNAQKGVYHSRLGFIRPGHAEHVVVYARLGENYF